MKRRMIKLTGLCLSLLSVSSFAQQAQPLPLDPKVRYGKLENGLTYYIRANKEPKQRADFYIAQNVGAILEEDNQNGLAHFLEHMAFNGTKNYPGKGILNYLEKNGVKFGENINAYTALDETVYNLSNVPTVRDGLIDSALLVLHDWSGFISLEDAEIDAERGVIREEWRQGAGANRRMWKESNKLKYAGSQYAKRDVIGDTAVINHFAYKTLRDFYQKWYRPDLQAIVVVGDVDVERVEARIKSMFTDIPGKQNPDTRVVYSLVDNKEPVISVVKDPEAQMTRIELEYKHNPMSAEQKLSMNGYVFNLMNGLISGMLNERFNEMTQQANAPFVGAYATYGELVKSKDAFQMLVAPKEGKELEGLSALLLEAEKIKRFGFTNAEFERAKTDMLKGFEKGYNERDNVKNASLVQEYVRHFLSQEVVPGIEWEYNASKAIVPQLKLDMLNQIAKSFVTDSNLIVSVMAPDKPAVKIPTSEQILKAISDVRKAPLKAKAEEKMNQKLIDKKPKAGKIKSIQVNPQFGTTEWTLGNGLRVIFKPTTFKQDEIIMSSYSPGGVSTVKNQADIVSAEFAADIVANNGVGKFNSVELGKVLTGKIASVMPSIEQYEQGLSGESSVADFETMLQLAYLYFTAPRHDDNAFAAMMNGYRTGLANSASDPRKAFSDSVSVTVSNHNPRRILLNLETLTKVDQAKAIRIFKERFAAPGDFTFIFTGNINPADPNTEKAILTYLGGLKPGKTGQSFVDNGIRNPKGKVNNYFARELKVKKASNYILYTADMPFSVANRTAVSAIASILTMRYTESIREKEGGSYGVGVRGDVAKLPVEQASLMMQFDTDPSKQARLMGIIHSEVAEIVSNGPKAEDLQKVKENMLKKYQENLRDNNWWTGAVERFYKENFNMVESYTKSVEALDAERIKTVLKEIVSQGNVIEVVMKPTEN